ncbi:unnamed protein product [Prunus armeniaca]
MTFQRGAQARVGSGTHEDGLTLKPVQPELKLEGWADVIVDARLASTHSLFFLLPRGVIWAL